MLLFGEPNAGTELGAPHSPASPSSCLTGRGRRARYLIPPSRYEHSQRLIAASAECAGTLADVFTVAGGTLLPAELALPPGTSQVVSNDANYYINYDETAFGHAFVHFGDGVFGDGGALTFANVNGGSGGLGAVEIRYAASFTPTAFTISVNGSNFTATVPTPFNEPAWRTVNWLTHRFENVPLQPGTNNTIVLSHRSIGPSVDHLVVSTPDDFALAAPHRCVLALPQTDRDNLLAYLRELDGSPLPGQSDPPVITAPPVSALVVAGTNHTFSVTATGPRPSPTSGCSTPCRCLTPRTRRSHSPASPAPAAEITESKSPAPAARTPARPRRCAC